MTRLRISISMTRSFPEDTPLIAEIANAKYPEPLRVPISERTPREIEVEPGLCSIRVFSTWGEVTSRSILAITDQLTDTVIRLHPWGEETGMLSTQESERAETITVRLRYLIAPHDGFLDQIKPQTPVVISSAPERVRRSVTETWRISLAVPSHPFSATSLIEVGGEVDMSRIMLLPPDQQVTVMINRRLVFEQDSVSSDQQQRDAPADRVEVHVSGQFRPAESLRQYLRIGDIASAEVIARPLIRAQVDSFENWGHPQDLISTLLCGYFSLRTGEFSHFDKWTQLYTWLADSSADAAIILGWHWLASGETQGEEKARDLFTQSFSKFWLPVYTEGFKLLWDGLRFLHRHTLEGNQREGLEYTLGRIEPYAANADWTQPHTTFYGHNPYSPARGRRFENPRDALSIELTGKI